MKEIDPLYEQLSELLSRTRAYTANPTAYAYLRLSDQVDSMKDVTVYSSADPDDEWRCVGATHDDILRLGRDHRNADHHRNNNLRLYHNALEQLKIAHDRLRALGEKV
jgi:hypothetical protein